MTTPTTTPITRSNCAPPDCAPAAAQVRAIREQERQHLARELHDVLGGLLLGAKLDVACLQSRLDGTSAEVDARLRHLSEVLNNAMALKRQVVQGLQPAVLAEAGLVVAVERLARSFAAASGIKVSVQLAEVALDAPAQLAVYRLVEEALTNIGKHARASEVAITLKDTKRGIEATVRDNGIGMGQVHSAPGVGLTGMRHRIEACGGILSVSSVARTGTTLRALLQRSSAVERAAAGDLHAPDEMKCETVSSLASLAATEPRRRRCRDKDRDIGGVTAPAPPRH